MNRLLSAFLRNNVRQGTLIVTAASGEQHRFGDGSAPQVHVEFSDRKTENGLLFDPALKLGECYMQGTLKLHEGSIYQLLELMVSNMEGSVETRNGFARFALAMRDFAYLVDRGNNLLRSRSNVQHHYDLSGALYDLFLDEDRQYSCGYYPTADTSLEEAQLAKKRHIASKLYFTRPGMSVLDIGCGWGGMGLYLAKTFDADVTGVTLSDEQLAIANERARNAGLESRAQFHLRDYRQIDRKFDRIVSVGMFEHVGRKGFDEYFAKAYDLLDDDGVMLMHTIGQANPPSATNPFISKYIFPGGYIPAMSEVLPAIERSGLMLADVEVLRNHYADTLRDWSKRFHANWDKAAELYDEAFCRMWDFYLASSEAAFRYLGLNVFQFQLVKKRSALPATRDYMLDNERNIASMEGDSIHRIAAE